MNGKARVLLFLVLLAMVSGCASQPVFSVEVFKTPTPAQFAVDPHTATAGYLTMVPSLHPTQDGIATHPLATLPAFTQASVPTADFSPILYGEKYDANTFFLVLGGVQGDKWILPEQAVALMQGASEYEVYPWTGEPFQVLGYAPESAPVHPGQYFVKTNAAYDRPGMVGVAHGWPVRQARAQELSADHETYRQIVRDFLKQAGISDPQPGTVQIYRVDLEEDGVDEIFINATRLDASQHSTRAGDYSIVLMRKVDGNGAVTLPVVADVYLQNAELTYPNAYSLGNFIDLNRDGVMEVVVDTHRWEQDGALLYTIEGLEIVPIP